MSRRELAWGGCRPHAARTGRVPLGSGERATACLLARFPLPLSPHQPAPPPARLPTHPPAPPARHPPTHLPAHPPTVPCQLLPRQGGAGILQALHSWRHARPDGAHCLHRAATLGARTGCWLGGTAAWHPAAAQPVMVLGVRVIRSAQRRARPCAVTILHASNREYQPTRPPTRCDHLFAPRGRFAPSPPPPACSPPSLNPPPLPQHWLFTCVLSS